MTLTKKRKPRAKAPATAKEWTEFADDGSFVERAKTMIRAKARRDLSRSTTPDLVFTEARQPGGQVMVTGIARIALARSEAAIEPELPEAPPEVTTEVLLKYVKDALSRAHGANTGDRFAREVEKRLAPDAGCLACHFRGLQPERAFFEPLCDRCREDTPAWMQRV